MPRAESCILTTDRLRLRHPEAADREPLLAIYGDEAIARFLLHPAWTSLDDAARWITAADDARREDRAWRFVIERRSDARCIGTCQLFSFHRPSGRAEVGYALARQSWGRGTMHEAMRALIDYAFGDAGLRRLEADIDPANTASARLLARLGFVQEGRLRERWCVDGVFSDSDIYGLLAADWQSLAGSRA